MQAVSTPYPQETTLGTGRVQAVINDVYMIVGPLGMVRAKRAAGCLLMPQKNDLVLLMLGQNCHYVLHVLERQEQDQRQDTLLLPPHTVINTQKSEQSTHSIAEKEEQNSTLQFLTHSLSIQASSKININSKALNLRAHGMTLFASVLHMRGGILKNTFASIRNISAHMFSRIANSMALFGKRIERVDGLWDAKAKRVQVEAKETLQLRATDTNIKAKERAAMDGKHVHIG